MGEIEYIHFPADEIDLFERTYLLEQVVEGLPEDLAQAALYTGFAISKLAEGDVYQPGTDNTYAVNLAEWQEALEQGNSTIDPFYYATNEIDMNRTFAAIGVYDSSKLYEDHDLGMYRYRTIDGSEISDACQRVVVWDQ